MRIQGVKNVYSAAVVMGDGTASLSFETTAREAQLLLGKIVTVYGCGEAMDCIITGIGEMGSTSGIGSCSGMSVVQHALTLQYRGPTTQPPNQITTGREPSNVFSGVLFGDINTTTRETEALSIGVLIQRLFNGMNDEFSDLYNRVIEVEIQGQFTSKVDYLEWHGDTLGELIDRVIVNEKSVSKRIVGNRLIIEKVNFQQIDKTIRPPDVVNGMNLSINLENCAGKIYVESPHVSTFDVVKNFTSTMVYGLPARVDTGSSSVEIDAGFDFVVDPLRSIIVTDGTAGSTNVRGSYDSRVQIDTGSSGTAYVNFNWRKYQVLIEESLGIKDGATFGAFNRTTEMNELGRSVLNDLSEILVIGRLTVSPYMRLQIGDVVMLPGCAFPTAVVGLMYQHDTPLIEVTVGHISGAQYAGLVSRSRIAAVATNATKPVTEQSSILEDRYGRTAAPRKLQGIGTAKYHSTKTPRVSDVPARKTHTPNQTTKTGISGALGQVKSTLPPGVQKAYSTAKAVLPRGVQRIAGRASELPTGVQRVSSTHRTDLPSTGISRDGGKQSEQNKDKRQAARKAYKGTSRRVGDESNPIKHKPVQRVGDSSIQREKADVKRVGDMGDKSKEKPIQASKADAFDTTPIKAQEATPLAKKQPVEKQSKPGDIKKRPSKNASKSTKGN